MVTRRGLLGMFAAGAAAAVLPSGIIMPVRKIVAPRPEFIGMDMGAYRDAMVFGIGMEQLFWDGREVRHVYLPADAFLRDQLQSFKLRAGEPAPVGPVPRQSQRGLA